MRDDYWVPSRSNEDLERLAEQLNETLNPEGVENLDILEMLRRAGNVDRLLGLELIEHPDHEMGNAFAYATGGNIRPPPRIHHRASVTASLLGGHVHAKMTLAHELGHLWVHPQESAMPRLAGAGKVKIPAHRSAEHQAKYFAGAFLMPRSIVLDCCSPDELAHRCGVSLEAAKIRWEIVVERHAKKKIPQSAKHNMAEIKAASSHRTHKHQASKEEEAERQAIWERTPHPTGMDMVRFRLSYDGTPVAWDLYEQVTPYGWYIADGSIFSYARFLKKNR